MILFERETIIISMENTILFAGVTETWFHGWFLTQSALLSASVSCPASWSGVGGYTLLCSRVGGCCCKHGHELVGVVHEKFLLGVKVGEQVVVCMCDGSSMFTCRVECRL